MQPQLSAILLSEWQYVKWTCVSKKLLDLEHRSVIKFLTKEGKKSKDILERMVAVYGESAPSYYKVKFWSKQFKWRRESIEDDPHTGRPVEATSEEMCQ